MLDDEERLMGCKSPFDGGAVGLGCRPDSPLNPTLTGGQAASGAGRRLPNILLIPSLPFAAEIASPTDAGVWGKLLIVAACVILPVLWGILVNWLFDLWRRSVEPDDDRIFPDYQI